MGWSCALLELMLNWQTVSTYLNLELSSHAFDSWCAWMLADNCNLLYFLRPSCFVATFTAPAGLRHGSPVRLPTNMLGGSRPGPRALSYASCVRTLPSLPK